MQFCNIFSSCCRSQVDLSLESSFTKAVFSSLSSVSQFSCSINLSRCCFVLLFTCSSQDRCLTELEPTCSIRTFYSDIFCSWEGLYVISSLLKSPFVNVFKACLVLTVIIFSKLISLIYFNLFIEDFELLMLVSSLIYLAFLAFFVLEIKVVF